MIQKKNICILLVMVMLASILCIGVSAVAEYNTPITMTQPLP